MEQCKRTIVGKFLKIRPQIEKIRSRFSEKFPLKGSVKIGVYDNYNVVLDFTNDEDCNTVWFRRVVEIEGLQMWLQNGLRIGSQMKIFPLFRYERFYMIAISYAHMALCETNRK